MNVPRATAARLRAPVPVRDITPAEVQARLSHRLRQIIGPGRRATLTEAARLTGINARTLKAYVAGTACPNVARYGRLLRVFGPEVGIELALMLGWEPRATNPALPQTEDLRGLRDAVAQAIRAIDLVLAHGARVSRPQP
ncbi:MAG: hypothetical protein JNK67_25660 [Alphaproteobacteria bacterium]|nr:hypothetical protein [Alphaproteobacteria bacterium]